MNNPQKVKKRPQYTRDEFWDKEVYNEIKDQIRQIRQRNLKQVEEDSLINKLYEEKKRQMKINRLQSNKQSKGKTVGERDRPELGDDDQEEGEIKKPDQIIEEKPEQEQQAVSINDLGKHILPITITRSKMAQLYKSRKFEEIVKNCFVRYKSQNSNSYVLALILGLVEGDKQYQLNNNKIRTQLKLQQSSSQVIKLTLDHISNQHPSGNLQISKWLQANRSKIPKQKQLKQKLEQLNNLIHGKVSSHDIDKNLMLEAQRVAHGKAQGNQNLSELIFFMKNHIHDLTVTIEDLEGNKSEHAKFTSKIRQKKECQEILTKLNEKEAQNKAQKALKQKQDKKSRSRGYLDYIESDRKQDHIRQVYHKHIQYLCSYEGSHKIKQDLEEAHRGFDLDVSI